MTVSTPSPQSRSLWSRLAAIEDGTILRLAFYAMLAGAVSVLVLDYFALNDEQAVSETGHVGDPVLPAVDRPEIDPSSPAFRPHERVVTPHDILSQPLEIVLQAGGLLRLTGTIMPGAAAAFAEEVEQRGSYVETVVLDSPGGSVEDALAIAQVIRDKGYATAVEDGALCASSCPLLLAAGTSRQVAPTASVGVHQIYTAAGEASGLSPAQAMSDAQAITARIARRLTDYAVDPALWVHAMETPPDRLYYLTREELVRYGLSAQ